MNVYTGTYNRTKYYVDKEKRTIVCVINNTQNNALDLLQSTLKHTHNSLYKYFPYIPTEDLKIKDSYLGKAVCSKDDTWDEAKGRRIAYHRARYKLDKSMFKRVQKYFSNMDTVLDTMEAYTNKFFSNEIAHARIREQEIAEDTVKTTKEL